MTREEVFKYVAEQYGTDPEHPWFDANAVLRHRDNSKWYAVVLVVGRDKLGLEGDGMIDVINLKCDPLLVSTLKNQSGYHPAYHMNKEKWISVRLDGTVDENDVKNLIDMSYQLTAPKRRKGGSK